MSRCIQVKAALRSLSLKKNALRLLLNAKKSTKDKKTSKDTAQSKQRFKSGWREIAEKRIFARSRWEANFGRYLQWQKDKGMIAEWEHEPQIFWFEGIRQGCVSYLPDFKVTLTDGSHYWIEVKGFMDPKSATKIKRFRKFFPNEAIRVIDSKWYKSNSKKLFILVPGWEKDL